MAKNKKKSVTNVKAKRHSSPTTKQKKLIDLSTSFNTKLVNNIYGVFLVRQGLRSRSEQFMAIATSYVQAIRFCRNTLTPKYCTDNDKQSLHFLNKKEQLDVNYSKNQLMVKGADFVRTQEGRTNSNPLWYWNVARINIIKTLQEMKDG